MNRSASVKRFERSLGPDTALHKNVPLPLLLMIERMTNSDLTRTQVLLLVNRLLYFSRQSVTPTCKKSVC